MQAWILKNSTNRLIKFLLIVLGMIPMTRLLVLGNLNQLSANPIEFITRSTGTWALVFLCITLTISPLRTILKWNGIVRFRRTLGLIAFFYASLHFFIWIYLDHQLNWEEILKDFYKRTYILFGLIAFLIMSLLAMTSNQWSIQMLKQKWSSLHKLIYPLSILALLHYWIHKAAKNDFGTVSIYATVVLSLLLFRSYKFLKRRYQS